MATNFISPDATIRALTPKEKFLSMLKQQVGLEPQYDMEEMGVPTEPIFSPAGAAQAVVINPRNIRNFVEAWREGAAIASRILPREVLRNPEDAAKFGFAIARYPNLFRRFLNTDGKIKIDPLNRTAASYNERTHTVKMNPFFGRADRNRMYDFIHEVTHAQQGNKGPRRWRGERLDTYDYNETDRILTEMRRANSLPASPEREALFDLLEAQYRAVPQEGQAMRVEDLLKDQVRKYNSYIDQGIAPSTADVFRRR